MKLYNLDLSPYCARVRYFIYSRNIPCEIIARDSDLAGFRETSPLGKVPALVTDTGARLFESEAINEYLAEICRPPVFVPLMPESPEERALARAFTRLVDLYLAPHMPLLWTRMDEAAAAKALEGINNTLNTLEGLIQGPLVTSARRPVLADAAIGSMLIHIEIFGGRVNLKPLESRPKMRLLYETLLKDVAFAKVRQETMDDVARMRKALKAASANSSNKL